MRMLPTHLCGTDQAVLRRGVETSLATDSRDMLLKNPIGIMLSRHPAEHRKLVERWLSSFFPVSWSSWSTASRMQSVYVTVIGQSSTLALASEVRFGIFVELDCLVPNGML